MRCAVGSGGSGRRSRGRRSTYDEQRSRGRSSTHAVLNYSNPGKEGLGTAHFAELAAGAGVRAYGVTPGGCLQILANAGAAKNGPMLEFGRLGVG